MTEAVQTLDAIVHRYKRGDVRDDGKIFWQYGKRYKDCQRWISKSQYDLYQKNCAVYHNSENAKQLRIKYINKNRSYINKRYNNYRNAKRKTDNLFLIASRVRGLIRTSLRRDGYPKKSNTEKILGCSFNKFKSYIEQRFQNGMTWENKTQWHLDHIVPVSSAKSEKEIIRLNHYTNFRPLWAKENLAKGKKQTIQLKMSV